MVQYRFSGNVVDSVCSVPLHQGSFADLSPTIGEVVGTINNNVVVTRYADEKYFYYDTYFLSPEKFLPLGTSQRGGFGWCNEGIFLSFHAGRSFELWAEGSLNEKACDMSNPNPRYYLSYDFSFDPRMPVENFSDNPPDTTLREYNGYLTSDSLIKNSQAVFIDTAKSLIYLFSETKLSIYSLTLETVHSNQPQKPVMLHNRFSFMYIPARRQLRIDCTEANLKAAMRLKLFSLNGSLLFIGDIVPGASFIDIPRGIMGMVLVKVDGSNKRTEGKIMILR